MQICVTYCTSLKVHSLKEFSFFFADFDEDRLLELTLDD